jgi:hypothetical protein
MAPRKLASLTTISPQLDDELEEQNDRTNIRGTQSVGLNQTTASGVWQPQLRHARGLAPNQTRLNIPSSILALVFLRLIYKHQMHKGSSNV